MPRHWLLQILRFYREDWWRVLVAVALCNQLAVVLERRLHDRQLDP
jgi:putative exporter of polyketide antibiotics